MKISAKLLILALAIFLVSASVVFFFKAMTTPPTHMKDVDEFSVALNKDIDNISESSSPEELDSIYIWILQELKKWNGNEYFDDAQYDKHIKAFYQKFVPTYVNVTQKKLSHDSWGDGESNYIVKQVELFKSENLIGKNKTVIDDNADLKTKLADLIEICSNYKEAVNLVASTVYTDIDDAKNRINQAKDLAENVYISHSDVNTKLSSLPNDIGNSHFEKLNSYYSKMENWSYYTIEQTEDNYSKFEQLADDYKLSEIYGGEHPKTISDMTNQVKQYMQDAYDNKCTLYVNGRLDYLNTSTWSNSSGTCTYDIITNHPEGYSVSDLPNWIEVKEQSEDKLTVSYDESTLSSSRNGYFNVKAGKKMVRVYCTQNAPKNEINITSINTNHNVWKDGKKGMDITVYFNATGFQGKTLYVNLYFYFIDGKPLKDYNNKYRTNGGDVATHQTYTPYSDYTSTSVTIFMPYNELHLAKGNHSLKFDASIMYDSKSYASSSYYSFDINQN